jgi:HNH endonuclease
MDPVLREFVRERAGHRCENCHLPQAVEPFFTYHLEHIVARQHGGGDEELNLALACYHTGVLVNGFDCSRVKVVRQPSVSGNGTTGAV